MVHFLYLNLLINIISFLIKLKNQELNKNRFIDEYNCYIDLNSKKIYKMMTNQTILLFLKVLGNNSEVEY